MTTGVKSIKTDPYQSNEYLLLRAGSAENGDPNAVNLIAWINRDLGMLRQSPLWREPEGKPGFIYPAADRYTPPTIESAQRVIELIEAFAAAGAMLKYCLAKWPDRFFLEDPPPELLAAYRLVNKMLHAYRGEYGIDPHHQLRQPAFDKHWRDKKLLKAEIRVSRTLDIDATAGLLLGFAFVGNFPFGEQLAVADLLGLVRNQRFYLLRKCNAPVASRRGEREIKEIPPCGRWFMASRIDQKFCSKACGRRDLENTPEFRDARKVWARKHYADYLSSKKPKNTKTRTKAVRSRN